MAKAIAYCDPCKNAGMTEPATRIMCVSGTGKRTGKFFDHARLAVCDRHYEEGKKGPAPDEVIHHVYQLTADMSEKLGQLQVRADQGDKEAQRYFIPNR